MNATLVMRSGDRAGSQYALSLLAANQIGRGLECEVVLTDAECSRVHAIVTYESDAWWVRDAESRNGTYVNGQKVEEAQLADGNELRVGSTVFEFQQVTSANTADSIGNTVISQQVVFDERIDPKDTANIAIAALQQHDRAEDFLTLYQLSIKLLGCDDPDEVIRTSLELLQERTKAAVIGFLWVADDGHLKPKMVIPEEAADKVELSQSLTELVCKKGHAVRLDSRAEGRETNSLSDYVDTFCVPLIHEKDAVGAIHVYLDRGNFLDSDFEVAKSVANILVVALVRARKETALRLEHDRLAKKSADSDELIGESKPILDLKSKINRIARASGCVLVRGESGSGKELVARALHRASPRADRPMLSVNCAAIPADLIESQLFGHKKGAFTSADSDHAGLFEQADSGTLFLDEVGEMTLEGQAKLLRILEGHPFLPVGATKELSVDVRVIAATNRDLREFVSAKKFREDLYYRLSVFELHIPPLHERGSDIELLINHFLQHFRTQHGRFDLQLSEDVRRTLLSYQWPGNVRQLRNVIDSAVVMAEANTIEMEDIGLRDTGSGELESLKLDFWERRLITEALNRTSGNVPEAAKLVGIGRATLYRKIDEYGIKR